MRPRRVFLATSVIAITACGISAVGELADAIRPSNDGGPDAPFLLPDGARPDGGGDVDVPDVDTNIKCLAACDGGCDAGTCVIDCPTENSCAGGAVQCPAGIACSVTCAGKTSCSLGVHCTSSTRCDIACTGEGACAGGVACTGSSCNVDCTGLASACTGGVQCDAGSCNIACGKDDCSGAAVGCVSDDCHITCGVDAALGEKSGCKSGVSCIAQKSCIIDCLSDGTCQTGVRVISDGGAEVNCIGKATCKGGVFVGARDASILCEGDDSCEGVVDCDAGHCTFDCTLPNDKAINACCFLPNCVADSGQCTDVNYTCP